MSDSDYGLMFVFHPIYLPFEEMIFGYECLMRLVDSELGILTPKDIMPAVSQDEDIRASLENWTFSELKHVASIIAEENPDIKMLSINIDTENFFREDFFPEVRRHFGGPNNSTKNIYFEFKQEIFKNTKSAIYKLGQLRSLGIKVAIDNVGESFKDIVALNFCPFDMLKIDRAYITNLLSDERSRDVVEHIIEYALARDVDLVAMGVENKETEQLLPTLGCFKMQGYYYSKPLALKHLTGGKAE